MAAIGIYDITGQVSGIGNCDSGMGRQTSVSDYQIVSIGIGSRSRCHGGCRYISTAGRTIGNSNLGSGYCLAKGGGNRIGQGRISLAIGIQGDQSRLDGFLGRSGNTGQAGITGQIGLRGRQGQSTVQQSSQILRRKMDSRTGSNCAGAGNLGSSRIADMITDSGPSLTGAGQIWSVLIQGIDKSRQSDNRSSRSDRILDRRRRTNSTDIAGGISQSHVGIDCALWQWR